MVGGDGGFTRVNQSNPKIIYGEFTSVSLYQSTDGGQNFNYIYQNGINNKDFADGDNMFNDPSDPDSVAFYAPYILDPTNQSRVLYGTTKVYESLNDGGTFVAKAVPGTTPGFNGGQIIRAIGAVGNTVYVSTSSAHLYVSTDNEATFTDRYPTVAGVKAPFRPNDIYVNPAAPNEAIVNIPTFTFTKQHVYRTTDAGVTWADISGNLPAQAYQSIKVDKVAGVIYVAGDDGVYASSDYGLSWARYGANLPNVQVVDLSLNKNANENVLAAGTHGRGLFEIPLTTNVARPNIIATSVLSRNGAGQVVDTDHDQERRDGRQNGGHGRRS